MARASAGSRLLSVTRSFWRFGRGWFFILVAALISLWLGCVGFAKYGEIHDLPYSKLDIAYLAWQLFPLQSGALPGPLPWQLEIARVLAPLATASAILRVLFAFLRDRWRLFKLAIVRDHVVVCGLGRRGLQLAEECRAQGHRVVVIESDPHAEGLPAALEAGLLVVNGDAAHTAILKQAHVERAKTLVAICGDDGVNIEIALRAREVIEETKSPGVVGRLNCLVQVMDFTFATLFKEHPVFEETGERLDVSIFNSYENAVRLLLREHPLDREFIGADDPRRVHLIVFGLGQMGESLVVQAAKTCHFANGKRLLITVIDHSAEARGQGLYVRYPQFDKVCDIEFIKAECDDAGTLRNVVAIANDTSTINSIAICFDNDSRNAQYALSVRRHLESDAVPIFVRINQDSGLSSLFDPSTNGRNMFCFGSTCSACSWRMVTGYGLDRLARIIHGDYVNKQRERGAAESSSIAPWDRLLPGFRDSNRQQADHLTVKLRALGYDVRHIREIADDEITIPDDAVETLARMEHARWNAERYLAGWTLGDKDADRRRSPYLVPYDELPEGIKDYDRDTVHNIPRLIKAACGHAASR